MQRGHDADLCQRHQKISPSRAIASSHFCQEGWDTLCHSSGH
jgi:hypothetical protein